MVGLVGFEPAAFARKQRWAVPTGFFTAPELLHPILVRKPVYLPSGARRHTVQAAHCVGELLLDYSPCQLSLFKISPYIHCVCDKSTHKSEKLKNRDFEDNLGCRP